MKLSQLIDQKNVFIHWPCENKPEKPDKWLLIQDALECLATVNRFPEDLKRLAITEVIGREKSMSTGIGEGVALPHASIQGLQRPVGMLCTLPDGIDFDSIDHKPAFILVLLLVPKNEFRQHIKTLAGIARLLHDSDFRSQMLQESNPQSLYSLIAEKEKPFED